MEDKENISKATPTPRKKSAAEKPVVNFRIMEQERKEYIDREWAKWEQLSLTQLYPPTLSVPPGREEDDWMTQATI